MFKKSKFTLLRIVTDAVLAAIFFVLTFFSIRIGNTFKITFDSLAVVIPAMLFGPVDGFIVGFVGASLEQLVSPYGLTATTLLWIIPPALRGLVVGLGVRLFPKQMTINNILARRRPYVYFAVCLVASVCTSLTNTFALFIDSKLFNYYTFELVVGALGMRLIIGVTSAIITAILALPIIKGLLAAHVVSARS